MMLHRQRAAWKLGQGYYKSSKMHLLRNQVVVEDYCLHVLVWVWGFSKLMRAVQGDSLRSLLPLSEHEQVAV